MILFIFDLVSLNTKEFVQLLPGARVVLQLLLLLI